MAISRKEIESRKDMIVARLGELRTIAKTKFGDRVILGSCGLDFTLRGAKAGVAYGTGKIALNIDMIAGDSFEHILNETLPHEYAHIICLQNGLDRGHGKNWKSVAKILGCSGERCHKEPVKYARGKTYEYVASCGSVIRISETIHKRILRGRSYSLKTTGGKLHSKCEYKLV